MRVAVIGTGSVGTVLGRQLARAGHTVVFGARDPDGAAGVALAEETGAGIATPRAAAADADVVLLAVPWSAAREVVEGLGELTGRVLVDCTNPLRPDLSGLATDGGDSAGEQVARWAPGARVVKAFNTTGAANMADPVVGGQRLFMPVCGDDAAARALVMGLAADVGFEPVDAGPLRQAGLLEALAMLWISLAYGQGMGPGFGLALLRRA